MPAEKGCGGLHVSVATAAIETLELIRKWRAVILGDPVEVSLFGRHAWGKPPIAISHTITRIALAYSVVVRDAHACGLWPQGLKLVIAADEFAVLLVEEGWRVDELPVWPNIIGSIPTPWPQLEISIPIHLKSK